MRRPNIPHAWFLFAMLGALVGSAITTSVNSRWGDPLATLFGEFGIVTVVTGIITVFFLGYRAVVGHLALLNTQSALEHAQRAEIAVRYQKGMEMLSNEHESTRIGGLYLLRDVASALPDVYWASVSDSLFPFIRKNCAPLLDQFQRYRDLLDNGGDPEEVEAWLDTTPPDVIIALKILGRCWEELRIATAHHNLSGRHIRGLVLANVNIDIADFEGASFDGAIFQAAKFHKCKFVGCQMNSRATNTKFDACDLSNSEIYTNSVPFGPGNTEIMNCEVSYTEIDGSDLSEVSFHQTDLSRANILHPNATYY